MVKAFFSLLWALLFISLLFLEKINPFILEDDKRIDFFCWGDTIDQKSIALFEEATGAKIYIHPFSSNEELIVKLKATKGKGYDLICCSDYAIRVLKEENLLAPIQKEKISNLSMIDKDLLNHPFDPNNLYSLPLEWEPYVFVTFDDHKRSMEDLFDPTREERIVMTSDPVEAVSMASFALFGKKEALDSNELEKVKELLKNQRSKVEAYADHRARYLIETKNVDLAFMRSGFAHRMKKAGLPIYIHLPKDGHFINIENIAITASTVKGELIHQLIDFLLSKETQEEHARIMAPFPAHIEAESPSSLDAVRQTIQKKKEPLFFHYLASEEEVRDLWVSVKGS